MLIVGNINCPDCGHPPSEHIMRISGLPPVTPWPCCIHTLGEPSEEGTATCCGCERTYNIESTDSTMKS